MKKALMIILALCLLACSGYLLKPQIEDVIQDIQARVNFDESQNNRLTEEGYAPEVVGDEIYAPEITGKKLSKEKNN